MLTRSAPEVTIMDVSKRLASQRSSMVEQLICNQQVMGSIPFAGSIRSLATDSSPSRRPLRVFPAASLGCSLVPRLSE